MHCFSSGKLILIVERSCLKKVISNGYDGIITEKLPTNQVDFAFWETDDSHPVINQSCTHEPLKRLSWWIKTTFFSFPGRLILIEFCNCLSKLADSQWTHYRYKPQKLRSFTSLQLKRTWNYWKHMRNGVYPAGDCLIVSDSKSWTHLPFGIRKRNSWI